MALVTSSESWYLGDSEKATMAPKANNVAGSKRSRKGEASGSSGDREPVQNLVRRLWKGMGGNCLNAREKRSIWVMNLGMRGRDVKLSARILNELLGTPNCDPDEFNNLKDKPPYRDIRHTLCEVDSTARWERSKDTGRHNTLHLEMPINVGVILRQNMMKFRNNLRWRFCYGGLITHFLRAEGIEEQAVDMTVAYHPDLTGRLVDVTRSKKLDTSHEHVLSAQERQARDDSVMARMFGMAELQLRIGGRPVTDGQKETMAERYPLTESTTFLCRTGPTLLEPLDDDEATVDEAMNGEEDNAVDEEANALWCLMTTRSRGPREYS
uniref:Uncharacterized protein n=1 Tax=Solanum tuberosum TaxID=4113 RepID=M1C437_SOLTU